MRLHKIRVEKISLFHLKSITFDFYLYCSKSSSLTCALRCIISAYYINPGTTLGGDLSEIFAFSAPLGLGNLETRSDFAFKFQKIFTLACLEFIK